MTDTPAPHPPRVTVVTGGAMGIGAEVCARFAAAGHAVFVADRDLDAAQATASRLREQAGQAQVQALRLDVAGAASVALAFAQVDALHGRCDVLVNSAGIAKVFPFLDYPLDHFVETMTVNVTGTLLCAQH